MPAPLLRLFRPYGALHFEGAQLIVVESGVRVNRTTYIHDRSSFTFGLTLGQRGPSQIPLIFKPGVAYNPQCGWPVLIYEVNGDTRATICVYIGTVQSMTEAYIDNDGTRVVTLTCLSLEATQDATPTPASTYTGQNTGTIFTGIFNASSYAVPIALGTVQAGPTIADRTYSGTTSNASNYNTLTVDASTFVWYIDPRDQKVYFHASGARTNPVTLTTEKLEFGTLQWKQDSADFRTRQIILNPATGVVTVSTSPDPNMGGRFAVAVVPEGTSTTDATAQANAVLTQYSVLPSQFVFTSFYAGWYAGLGLTVALTKPPDAAARLNGGAWLIQDVQATWIPGMENAPEPYGHFQYVVTVVNSMAVSTTPQTLSSIVSGGSLGGGSGVITTPVTGAGALVSTIYTAVFGLSDLTVGSSIAPLGPAVMDIVPTSSPLQHYVGNGVRIIAVLKKAITADLEVHINVGANTWDVIVPSTTSAGGIVVVDISGSTINDLEIFSIDVIASDGSIDPNGIATFTVEWQVTVTTQAP